MGLFTVAVVGCGTLGRGIMEASAAAGLAVVGIPLDAAELSEPRAQIQRSLETRVRRGKLTRYELADSLARIELVDSFVAVHAADLVIDAAEPDAWDEAARLDLLTRLELHMRTEAVLGSHAPSLQLETIAARLLRPAHFLGLGFGADPIELAALARTLETALVVTEAFCRQLGKPAVRVDLNPALELGA